MKGDETIFISLHDILLLWFLLLSKFVHFNYESVRVYIYSHCLHFVFQRSIKCSFLDSLLLIIVFFVATLCLISLLSLGAVFLRGIGMNRGAASFLVYAGQSESNSSLNHYLHIVLIFALNNV